MKILLAEDNALLGDGIVTALTREKHTVDWFQDGGSALNAALIHDYELLILDLGLPVMNGLELLKQLRAKKKLLPTLILTSRDTTDDKIKGLDSGADDYLTKPFELQELLARIRVFQRRDSQRQDKDIIYQEIRVDTTNHSVFYKQEPVTLHRREFTLLCTFLDHPGRVYSREQLENQLYNWDEEVASNAVEVHIHHLRKKFYPALIETIRGVGYMVRKND
jgi:two-component system response regulator QseB